MKELYQWIDQHKGSMIRDLISLCSIKSVSDKTSSVKPFGAGCLAALTRMLALGEEDGFAVRNFDNYIGRIEWNPNGENAPAIGIWGHMDVVEEGEGWLSDPYAPEVRDGWLYGRGVGDNKNAAVGGFYIMKALRELNVPVKHNIHLYLGSSEEAGMQDLLYYKEHYPLPEFSLVPDAGFPGSIGEFGMLRIKFTAEQAFSGAVKALEAGTALNIVPDKAVAELAVDGGAGGTDITVSGGTVQAQGASSHAASPQNGRNAIKLLTDYLKDLDTLPDGDRAIFAALSLINADCYGKKLGIDFTHENYGSTVFSGTILHLVDGHAEVSCDCRFAIGDTADRIISVLEKMSAENGLHMEIISSKPCSFKDPHQPVIQRLKEVYDAYTGEDCSFEISRGGTYAGRMENAFGTGVVLKKEENPALKDMAGHGGLHQPDECIPVDGFVEGVKLLSDMLLAVDGTI